MRTIIDIPEALLGRLTAICKQRKVSRAEAVREAIVLYFQTAAPDPSTPRGKDPAFGLWKGRRLDGLKFERKLRTEWGK